MKKEVIRIHDMILEEANVHNGEGILIDFKDLKFLGFINPNVYNDTDDYQEIPDSINCTWKLGDDQACRIWVLFSGLLDRWLCYGVPQANTAHTKDKIAWNATNKTLDINTDIEPVLQVGQEAYKSPFVKDPCEETIVVPLDMFEELVELAKRELSRYVHLPVEGDDYLIVDNKIKHMVSLIEEQKGRG